MHKYLNKILSTFKVIIYSSAVALLIIGSLSWAKLKTNYVNPKYIFSGNTIVDDKEYKEYLDQTVTTNVIDDNYSYLARKIEKHPYVAGVRISKHFPNNILIEISERYPVALVNASPIVLIDNKSIVLPFRSNSFEFQIPIISNLNIDKNAMPFGEVTKSDDLRNTVDFLNRLKIEYSGLYDNLSEFRLNDYNEYELILDDEPTKIVIGDSMDWTKILVLQEFEKTLKNQRTLTDYVYLDLRYNNQVITKEWQV